MNTPYQTLDLNASASGQAPRLQKLLCFRVGKLHLAFLVEQVQKVMNYTPMHGSGTGSVGIIHLGDREITVIDLHRRLFKVNQAIAPNIRQYLILSTDSQGEQFGVLVGETPVLMDVPTSQIRLLPDSYRRGDTLSLASHVTVIPQAETSLTVFLLDSDRLLNSDLTSDRSL